MPHKEDVAWWRPLFLIALMPIGVLGNVEGDALNAFRQNLIDNGNVLQSWVPDLGFRKCWFIRNISAATWGPYEATIPGVV